MDQGGERKNWLDALADWRPTKRGLLLFVLISSIVMLPGEILTRVVGDRTGMLYNGLAAGSFFGVLDLASVRRGDDRRNDGRLWRFAFPIALVSAVLSWWLEIDPHSVVNVRQAGGCAFLAGLSFGFGCFSAWLCHQKRGGATTPNHGIQADAQADARG
jgi:hypothetical protein